MPGVKISSGGFDLPDGSMSRTQMRNAFLSTVATLVPEVFSDLYESTHVTFDELKAEYPKDYFRRDIECFRSSANLDGA